MKYIQRLQTLLMAAVTAAGIASPGTFAGDTITVPLRCLGSAKLTCAAYSPDGQTVVTSSDDKVVKLFNAATGNVIRHFTGHSGKVNVTVFSPDGRSVLTGSNDSTARIWDVATGACLKIFSRNQSGVYSAAFSSDGKRIVVQSRNYVVNVWDITTETCLRSMSQKVSNWQFCQVAFGPATGQILTGSEYAAILWDVETGTMLRSFSGHQSGIISVCFSRDGKQLLTGSYWSGDGSVKLWDVSTGSTLRTFYLGNSMFSPYVSFSPDSRTMLANWGSIKWVGVYDISSGDTLHALREHKDSVISAVYSPDGSKILTGSRDRSAKIWDAATGKCLQSIVEHSNRIVSVAYSPDGSKIVTGSWDSTAIVWDAAGIPLLKLAGNQGRVQCVAFSPDGASVALVSEDKVLTIRNTVTGEVLYKNDQFDDTNMWVSFSADGKKILASGYYKACAWDPVTQQISVTTVPSSVAPLRMSPDGESILSAQGNYFVLHRAVSGDSVRAFTGHTSDINYLSFSSDGSRCVSASFDKSVKLWNVATGECLKTFTGHTQATISCVMSPDGSQVLSCAADSTARLWDASTGDCVRLYRIAGGAPMIISAFSSDGSNVTTGDLSGLARVWPTPQWTSKVLPGAPKCVNPAKMHVKIRGGRIAIELPAGTETMAGTRFTIYRLDGRIAAVWNIELGMIRGNELFCQLPEMLGTGTYCYSIWKTRQASGFAGRFVIR